jgi:cytochrome P450
VASNAAVLLFGGIGIKEAMIANAFLHLLSNPAQQALIGGEPPCSPERSKSLRLEPAAAVVDRYVTLRRRSQACSSPAGIWSPSRSRCSRPLVFPARPVRRAAGQRRAPGDFARGPQCLGMHLARLETRMALERALARLPRPP